MRPSRNIHSIERELDAIVPNESPVATSADTQQRIADRLLESLHPVTPLPSRATLVAAFLAIFAVVTALLFVFVGTRGAENMTVLQIAGVLAAILAAAGLASVFLSGEMTPGQGRFIGPVTMTAGILFVLAALVFGLFPWAEGSGRAWHCFLSGFACSVPAVVLVLLVLRKGAPLAYGPVGATAGLLGGLVGMATIHVGCSILNAPHMTAGHLTIPLAGAIVGYLAGRTVPYLLPSRNQA